MIQDKPDATNARKAFHRCIEALERILPSGYRVLMVGKTDTYDYAAHFARGTYETVDRDPNVRATIMADIQGYVGNRGYDLVLLFGVYEFLEKPQAAIVNCEAMLSRAGFLVIGVPRVPRSGGTTTYAGGLRKLSALDLLSEWSCEEYAIGVYGRAASHVPAGAIKWI